MLSQVHNYWNKQQTREYQIMLEVATTCTERISLYDLCTSPCGLFKVSAHAPNSLWTTWGQIWTCWWMIFSHSLTIKMQLIFLFFNDCNMMPLFMLSFVNYHILHYVTYFKIGFCYYILRKNKNLDQTYIVIYIYWYFFVALWARMYWFHLKSHI